MFLRKRDALVATTLALFVVDPQKCSVHSFTMLGKGCRTFKTALSARPEDLLSKLELPGADLTPSVKAVSAGLDGAPSDLLPLVGVALVALAGAAFAVSGGTSSSSGSAAPAAPTISEKIDLSIPYDAAARLAYREMKGLKESDAYDEGEFLKFKAVYEETAIANVVVKKMERDLRDMQAAAEQKAKNLASLL